MRRALRSGRRLLVPHLPVDEGDVGQRGRHIGGQEREAADGVLLHLQLHHLPATSRKRSGLVCGGRRTPWVLGARIFSFVHERLHAHTRTLEAMSCRARNCSMVQRLFCDRRRRDSRSNRCSAHTGDGTIGSEPGSGVNGEHLNPEKSPSCSGVAVDGGEALYWG